VKKVEEDVFLNGALDGNVSYDFCMCNPPFFENESELDMRNKSRTEERAPPRNAQTGTLDELVSDGGELAFVSSIIKDSIELKERVTYVHIIVENSD
jgi:methyltransferase